MRDKALQNVNHNRGGRWLISGQLQILISPTTHHQAENKGSFAQQSDWEYTMLGSEL
ncbi:hypothetical protein [Rhizobium sp. CECT 9324]|uniref:hypothetical protein n=1 Tax=Rhizobium sp. CECT 9324 TaxID=2845820 RepID=UPI001E5BE096|nr:hypothetical protein [Rhizobium sp. CECT 9324]